MRIRFRTLGAGMLFIPLVFAADSWDLPLDEPQLRQGPGVEMAAMRCQVCHSADYISTQPPMNRAGWAASVQKMREKYGARIEPGEADQIIEYLTKAYSKR